MSTPKIENFTIHNNRGQSILDSELINWREVVFGEENEIFGPLIGYSWKIGEHVLYLGRDKGYLCELPDASGFICFEDGFSANNNCLLLNAFGLERMRLTVPVELTKRDIPKTNQRYFCNISSHIEGQFGVRAWIEASGSGGY